MSTSTAIDAPSTPEPDMAFLEAAYEKFSDTFSDVASKYPEQFGTEKYVSHRMRIWLLDRVPHQPRYWTANHRIITTLLSGIEDGLIVFRGYNDSLLFSSVSSAQLHLFPSLVEHFVGTGELLSVLECAEETIGGIVSSDKETPALSALRVRLLRLYCFDLFGTAELSGVSTAPDADNDDQGDDEHDDEAESTVLPLAVRLHLSGFYRSITASQKTWDDTVRRLQHLSDCTEAQRLESFGELNAVGEESW